MWFYDVYWIRILTQLFSIQVCVSRSSKSWPRQDSCWSSPPTPQRRHACSTWHFARLRGQRNYVGRWTIRPGVPEEHQSSTKHGERIHQSYIQNYRAGACWFVDPSPCLSLPEPFPNPHRDWTYYTTAMHILTRHSHHDRRELSTSATVTPFCYPPPATTATTILHASTPKTNSYSY